MSHWLLDNLTWVSLTLYMFYSSSVLLEKSPVAMRTALCERQHGSSHGNTRSSGYRHKGQTTIFSWPCRTRDLLYHSRQQSIKSHNAYFPQWSDTLHQSYDKNFETRYYLHDIHGSNSFKLIEEASDWRVVSAPDLGQCGLGFESPWN